MCLIATEGALLVLLLFSFFYISTQMFGAMAPPNRPALHFALPMTGILILNSIAMWWSVRGVALRRNSELLLSIAIALLLGLAFIVLESFEWLGKDFTPRSDAYASAFYVLTGVHLAHVVVGTLMLVFLLIWSALDYFDEWRNVPILVVAAYWHMVNVVWIIYFFAIYAAPYFQ